MTAELVFILWRISLSSLGTWNVSKAMITTVIIETTSIDWDLWILQNDNGYGVDDAAIPKVQLMEAGNGNRLINLNHAYEDEDDTTTTSTTPSNDANRDRSNVVSFDTAIKFLEFSQ